VGIAAAVRDHLRQALRRRADGDPARLSQSARFSLAEVETAVAAAQAMLGSAAATLEREGENPAGTAAVNAAKLFANRIAVEAADTALQAAGGRAYLRPHPLERLYRDARAGALMRNTLDQCREEIARAVLSDGAIDAPSPDTD
jgi:alkylation response protein AidB-like acyl-CoA dehydrogenase